MFLFVLITDKIDNRAASQMHHSGTTGTRPGSGKELYTGIMAVPVTVIDYAVCPLIVFGVPWSATGSKHEQRYHSSP